MHEGDNMLADPAREDLLILVDELDHEIGSATKLCAHVEGLLHRAFSVVLFRDGESGPEILLSRRAACKYHSAGLWANSCCSHPRVGEQTIDAAYRRVHEELGCEASGLREVGAFSYRADFDNDITEYEFDHVIAGRCEGSIVPDPAEVSKVRWVGIDDLASEMASSPERFAVWAPTALSMAMEHWG